MSYKTFRMLQAFIGMIVGVVFAVSISLEVWVIPVVVVIVAMIAMLVLRRMVKEVYADERTYSIAYKASRLTVATVGICLPVIGAVLLVLARHDLSSTRAQIGFTLEYVTCGLLIINYIAYYYYSHNLGGR